MTVDGSSLGRVRGIGDRYRASRRRLTVVLESLSENDWETLVPACPGWRVRDVLAHLVGVIEDAAAGRIDGPPDPAQTADEVERHSGDAPPELLRMWSTLAPTFEDRLNSGSQWPAAIDVISHEFDICGALGVRGEREHPDIAWLADRLKGGLPGGVVVQLDGARGTEPHDAVRLRTNSFEFLRLRLGRRSHAQVARLDWTGDPGELIGGLFVFGPSDDDLIE